MYCRHLLQHKLIQCHLSTRQTLSQDIVYSADTIFLINLKCFVIFTSQKSKRIKNKKLIFLMCCLQFNPLCNLFSMESSIKMYQYQQILKVYVFKNFRKNIRFQVYISNLFSCQGIVENWYESQCYRCEFKLCLLTAFIIQMLSRIILRKINGQG